MQIFNDPTGARWKRFTYAAAAAAAAGMILYSILAISIIRPARFDRPLPAAESDTGEIVLYDESATNRLRKWKGDEKEVLLTFDDGPDRRHTGKILKILRQEKIPAVFFVVGANAAANPKLLEQIYDEGHFIGNHTYYHLDSSRMPASLLKADISATQRLIESKLGIKTLLFRPPYSSDNDIDQLLYLTPVKIASEMGYFTLGMKADPKDWKLPGTEAIAQTVINYVTDGKGQIILLHDSGDDRSQTIAALPLIISGLREKGYRFVGADEFMGISREQVMTPLNGKELLLARVNKTGFIAGQLMGNSMKAVSLAGITIGVLRFLFVGILATAEKMQKAKRTHFAKYTPKVGVIVPAYNEGPVVNKSIQSILQSDYPNLEIIVVDDGSTDDTYKTVVRKYGRNKKVWVFTKPNGGKSDALNYGLRNTNAEMVVILDADTIVTKNAIRNLARHFRDPNIGAVAGNSKVGNRTNMLTKMQALEYITSQNLDRQAFCLLNCIRVVPGAIGMWRRQLLLDLGGFTTDTLAEDTDMTLKVIRAGYKVDYDSHAIAYTEAPDTISGFMKQRFRWMHGTLQAVWKHNDLLLRRKAGGLGWIALPDVWLFQVLFPIFAPLVDVLLVYNIAFSIVQVINHPENHSLLALYQAGTYYFIFLGVDYAAAIMSFVMERKENWKLLPWLFVQRFIYRQLLYFTSIKSTLAIFKGKPVGWGKLKRTDSVNLALATTG